MKIVILDRDGVINHDSDSYIKSADEWQPIDGSIEAISKLNEHGFQIAVATNQSGLGRNLFDEYALAQIHHKLCSMVEASGGHIDAIFYCPHSPDEDCACRKPKTGLLEMIESELACSLEDVYFVGDSLKDVDAAIAFGCKPAVVRTGNGGKTEKALVQRGDDTIPVFDDLSAAAEFILSESNSN